MIPDEDQKLIQEIASRLEIDEEDVTTLVGMQEIARRINQLESIVHDLELRLYD